MKKEHLKDINDLKSVQTDNVDLNMKRLKKMYADLKKEKTKAEDVHKKENDQLKKQKSDLESQIFIASKENKDKDDERKTILKIFDGMNEMLARMNLPNMISRDESSNSTTTNFPCDKCDSNFSDSVSLKKHKDEKHMDNTEKK